MLVLLVGDDGEMLLPTALLVYEPRWQSVPSLSVIASSSANTWKVQQDFTITATQRFIFGTLYEEVLGLFPVRTKLGN